MTTQKDNPHIARKLPTKPGLYYAKIDGKETVVLVDERMQYRHFDGSMFGDGNPALEWHGEPVPSLDQVREMRAQIEFLEWMAEAASNNKLRIRTRTYPFADTSISGPRGRFIASWLGQLRDGWRHWDAIKEAVK